MKGENVQEWVCVTLGLGKDERRPCRVKDSSCNEGTGRC